jgi:hypothetical protein
MAAPGALRCGSQGYRPAAGRLSGGWMDDQGQREVKGVRRGRGSVRQWREQQTGGAVLQRGPGQAARAAAARLVRFEARLGPLSRDTARRRKRQHKSLRIHCNTILAFCQPPEQRPGRSAQVGSLLQLCPLLAGHGFRNQYQKPARSGLCLRGGTLSGIGGDRRHHQAKAKLIVKPRIVRVHGEASGAADASVKRI